MSGVDFNADDVVMKPPIPPELLDGLRQSQPCLSQPHLPSTLATHVPVSTPPELLNDLRNLRQWYEEADRLERQIAQMTVKVQDNEKQILAARRQAAEAKTRKAHAARTIPKLSRARREIDTRSSEMLTALQAERETVVQRTKDNRGLWRSLQRLQARLEDTPGEPGIGAHSSEQGANAGRADTIEQVVQKQAELEEAARVEEETLKLSIEGMGNVQERLKQRVETERQKRLRLREAARAKLERVEESQDGLRDQLDLHEKAVSQIQQRLSDQEARTRAAEHTLAISRETARRASARVEQQKEGRRAMHGELLAVQRDHEELRMDLEMTLAKLEHMSEREEKAQQCWRLQHMERLDLHLKAKRDLDQDVVVAEELHVSVTAGGC